MVLLHLRVRRNLNVIPERPSQELEGPEHYCLLSIEHVWTSRPAHISPREASKFARGW